MLQTVQGVASTYCDRVSVSQTTVFMLEQYSIRQSIDKHKEA